MLYIKKIIIFVLLFNQMIFCLDDKKLVFCKIKEDQTFCLNSFFLRQIKDLFGVNIFIETGTFFGDTTIASSKVFENIYTVELSTHFYKKATDRFKNLGIANISLFNNNSIDFLSCIIPQIDQPMVIFLDAHYSGGITSKGDSNTPINRELDTIKLNRKCDCVILIDDLRLFREESYDILPSSPNYGYPGLDLLLSKGQEIFSNLGFVVFGDILIMYDADLHDIEISNVLKAMTEYKIKSVLKNISNNDLCFFSQSIGRACGIELDGINWLINLAKVSDNYAAQDFLVWNIFTLICAGQNEKAKKLLSKLQNQYLLEYLDKII